MLDASFLDELDLGALLLRKRVRTQAALDAPAPVSDSGGASARSERTASPSPIAAPKPATRRVASASATSQPQRQALSDAKPTTGVAAPAGRLTAPREEEELLRRRSPRSGGGGAVGIGISRSGAPGSAAAGTASRTAGPVGGAAQRGLASGSQTAVVKLASHASGRARIGALMTYQSHDGELALEREDGSSVQGLEAIRALAEQWSAGGAEREPSKDVLSFTLTLERVEPGNEIDAAVRDGLAGHRFAWRAEQSEDATTVYVVMSAAGLLKDEHGKSQRIFANEKSVNRLHEKLDEAFGVGTQLTRIKWAHGVDGLAGRLCRVSRDGEAPAQTSNGAMIDTHQASWDVASSWRRDLRSREARDTAHIILSAKPNTDKTAFMNAARATLAKEFPGHEYAFAMHTNRNHIHVHAIVRMANLQGERIDPNIKMFAQWRRTLAEEASERHIPMEATRRFDQANVPAYKLKDIRMVERGVAPEHVRRRVEDVKTHAIHIPSREEGRRRANEVAAAWNWLAQTRPLASEPPKPADTARLYRADVPLSSATATSVFRSDRGQAELAANISGARLSYVDIPASRLGEIETSRSNEHSLKANPEFSISAELAAGRKTIERLDAGSIEPFLERAKRAAEAADELHKVRESSKGENAVPSVEALNRTYAEIESITREVAALIPVEDREQFAQKGREALEGIALHIEEQKRLQSVAAPLEDAKGAKAAVEPQGEAGDPARIEGDGYKKPAPQPTDTFAFERKGAEIHYRHITRDGALAGLAYVDKGAQIEVNDWKNEAAVLSALKLSAEKWESVSIQGNARYTDFVVKLAAEHDIKITNPELQNRIVEARQRLTAPKEAPATMAQGAAEKQERTQAPTSAPAEAASSRPVQSPAPAPEPIDPDKGLKGIVQSYGQAPYDNNPKNAPSTFVHLRLDDGRETMLWGVAIKSALEDASIREGDRIAIQRTGKELVTRQVRVVDPETRIAHFEERQVNRAHWQVAKEPQHEQQLAPTPAEDKVALDLLRDRADREARRETNQADNAERLHETPASTDVTHPYRSQTEAATARDTARSLDNNPAQPAPTKAGQTPQVAAIRREQEEIAERTARGDRAVEQQRARDAKFGEDDDEHESR